MLGLVMDGVVAVLLVVTIAFALQLNTRLGALKNDRVGIERLITSLHAASRQAEEAIAGLKEVASHNGQILQTQNDKAVTLKSDLDYLIERGDALADRLEGGLKRDRAPTAPRSVGVQTAGALGPATPLTLSSSSDPGPRDAEEPEAEAFSTKSRLAAILRRVDNDRNIPPQRPGKSKSKLSEPAAAAHNQPQESAQQPQSRAERELQKALEARR